MSLKSIFLLFLILPLHLNASDCYDNRYKEIVFENYRVVNNVIYARKLKSNGQWENLKYDVYIPKNDTVTNRPVIMLSHGGGFLNLLDQKSPDITRIARDLVLRGYVVLSLDYRQENHPSTLANEQKLLNAQLRAHLDIREAHCQLMDTTLNYNNPFGIDINKVIIGGVSAGSMANLHAIFMDSVSWIPAPVLAEYLQIEPNLQDIFDNKFCGMNVLGMINISGSILDTAMMRVDLIEEYPALLNIHGTADPLVPFGIGNSFEDEGYFNQMGSGVIQEQAEKIGLRSELDAWPGASHVPFFGLELEALFSSYPTDIIFVPRIINATLDHIAEFCYSLINCNEMLSTGINHPTYRQLNVYPNPSKGQFTIRLSEVLLRNEFVLTLTNSLGQIVLKQKLNPVMDIISIDENLANGNYNLTLTNEHNELLYLSRLMISK